jgi:hypothetical protein
MATSASSRPAILDRTRVSDSSIIRLDYTPDQSIADFGFRIADQNPGKIRQKVDPRSAFLIRIPNSAFRIPHSEIDSVLQADQAAKETTALFRLFGNQCFQFAAVKENALASTANVDFDSLEILFGHILPALRAVHPMQFLKFLLTALLFDRLLLADLQFPLRPNLLQEPFLVFVKPLIDLFLCVSVYDHCFSPWHIFTGDSIPDKAQSISETTNLVPLPTMNRKLTGWELSLYPRNCPGAVTIARDTEQLSINCLGGR